MVSIAKKRYIIVHSSEAIAVARLLISCFCIRGGNSIFRFGWHGFFWLQVRVSSMRLGFYHPLACRFLIRLTRLGMVCSQ